MALVVALSSESAYAASSMWTGANIVDGSLTGADVQAGSITANDLGPGTTAGVDTPTRQHLGRASHAAWFTTQQASNDYETIASKSFTMPADGFITYQQAAKIAFSSDAT